MTSRIGLLFLGFVIACSSAPRGDSPDGETTPDAGTHVEPALCDPGPKADLPAAKCVTGQTPAKPYFRDATADWGLADIKVEGGRISVTDIDGDGWADLAVRRGGVRSDDFEAGTRHTWLLRNNGKGKFEDVTQSSGILRGRVLPETKGRPGETWAFGDVDNDGDIDVFTGLDTSNATNALGETSEILLNDGTGKFTLGAIDEGPRMVGGVDTPAGASFTDVDRDGDLDLWVAQHGNATTNDFIFRQDRFYLNDGAGNFAEATDSLGLKTEDWATPSVIDEGRAHSRAWSAAACDLNGDGFPELLAASYGRAPNHLWQSERRGDGSIGFVNRSVESGYAYDENFTWQDNQMAMCFCQSRPNAAGCDVVAPPAIGCEGTGWNHSQDRRPMRLGGNSGTTVCGDFDGDGDIDLLTTEIKHWWAGSGSDMSEILLNDGEPNVRFTRPGRESTGLVVPRLTTPTWDEGIMTAATFDFDNDGKLDLYLGASDYPGNRGLLYRQVTSSPLKYELVPVQDGFEHNRSHGVAVADFDRDGDLDIIVGHSRNRCDANEPANCYATTQVRLFENVAGEAANWLQLDLAGCGEATNRTAIGARVTVKAGGREQTQEITAGHGHYGMQNDRILHFGLGAACEAEITVRWPDAMQSAEVFTLPAGHRFRIRQGDQARVVE